MAQLFAEDKHSCINELNRNTTFLSNCWAQHFQGMSAVHMVSKYVHQSEVKQENSEYLEMKMEQGTYKWKTVYSSH